MVETALVAFTTFFATVGPVDVAALYPALTTGATDRQRRAIAIKGTIVATIVLALFVVLGSSVLAALGISLPALRTAGGILLLLIGIDLVFARHSGATTTTADESAEAGRRGDISVFPLATPLLAGPGAMSAAILLAADVAGDPVGEALVLGALAAVMALTLVLLLAAARLNRYLGVTGSNVISRVVGVLLCGLAVQFIFDGVRSSGLAG
ncbi:MAG: MarC family protein [Alphaproteobacteria bacterium]